LLIDLLTPHEIVVDERIAHLRFDIDLLAEMVDDATDWLMQFPDTRIFRSAISAPAPAPPLRWRLWRSGLARSAQSYPAVVVRISPDASIVLRLALPEESLSADLVSLADAHSCHHGGGLRRYWTPAQIVELGEFRGSAMLGSRCKERLCRDSDRSG
jgi:hypothetical protein